ncbi:MAG: hypothetical protein HYU99_07305 [Deltaproteobacteria bacterium]|nr:hypothetical protein [Deltaproteobacteria bacterium]
MAGKETMYLLGIEKSDQKTVFGVVNALGLWQMLALSPQTLPLLPAAIPGALAGGYAGHLIAPDSDASFHGSVIGGTASFLCAFARWQGASILSRFASMRAVTLASAAARHPVTLAAVGGVTAGSLINYGVTKAQTAAYGEEKTLGDMWYDNFEFVRNAMGWSANKSPWADWI